MKNKENLNKIKDFWNNRNSWQKVIGTEIIVVLVSLASVPFFGYIFAYLYFLIFKVLYTEYSVAATMFGFFGQLFAVVILPIFVAILICYHLLVKKNEKKFSRLTLISLYSLSSILTYVFGTLSTSQFNILKTIETVSQTRPLVLVVFIIFIFILNFIPPLWRKEEVDGN